MIKRLQLRRLLLLLAVLGLAFGGLGYRLVDLQVLRHDELAALAQQNTELEYFREPRRGRHSGRAWQPAGDQHFCENGLRRSRSCSATSRRRWPGRSPRCCNSTKLIYIRRLLPRVRQNEKGETVTNRYVVLQHKVRDETWQKIQQAMSRFASGPDEAGWPKDQRQFYRILRTKRNFCRPDG